jgi:hypothetical protein
MKLQFFNFKKEKKKKNPVLDVEALRVSISRTPSVLVILSTITAYIVKVFDKKPASFEV